MMKLRSCLCLLFLAFSIAAAQEQTHLAAKGLEDGGKTGASSLSDTAVAATGGVSPAGLDVAANATAATNPSVGPGKAKSDTNNQATIDQLKDAIEDSYSVDFYGSTVRSAYLNQPAATIIGVSAAARELATGSGIVAIIDTGVDPNHPALAGSLVQGYDFIKNVATIPSELDDLDATAYAAFTASTSVPESEKTSLFSLQQSTVAILDSSTVAILDSQKLPSAFGHGTMVAGLVHLVAPTASIMPLKAFESDGTGDLANIVRAIYFAVDNGAQVINMSFDAHQSSPDLQDALAYASLKGVLCIAAAGNEGAKQLTYPSSLTNVIGVGSTDVSDAKSIFSNYGTASEFMGAPGEALITTYPGGNYAGVWGTSFSAALVSGTTSLMLQVAPTICYTEATSALSTGAPVAGQELGDIRLNVFTAVVASQKDSSPPDQ